MTLIDSKIHPPRGCSRLLWRSPIWLYRANLGWLFGERFLLLNHVGRRSGQVRQAVIEVIKVDGSRNTYYVAAGFGPTSDWYQNLLKAPLAEIWTGRRRRRVKAGILSLSEAEGIIKDYARRHPFAMRSLAKVIGYEMKGGEVDYQAFVRTIPVVSLQVIEDIQ